MLSVELTDPEWSAHLATHWLTEERAVDVLTGDALTDDLLHEIFEHGESAEVVFTKSGPMIEAMKDARAKVEALGLAPGEPYLVRREGSVGSVPVKMWPCDLNRRLVNEESCALLGTH